MNNRKPKILAFAGSLRKGSYNKKLIRLAAKEAEEFGANVTLVDLSDLEIPMYNADDEESNGLPVDAHRLKRLFLESDALLIASPEYNSSITGVLKNTIDWVSRSEEEDSSPLAAFRGKVAGIISASPGNWGGLRGLVTLRSILGNIHVLVLPEQVCIPKAHEAFDESDHLKDEKLMKNLQNLCKRLVEVAQRQNVH